MEMQNCLNHGELSVMLYIPRAHKRVSIQVEKWTAFVMCCVIQLYHESGYINMCVVHK
jgi:hypothetical protein